MVGRLSTGSGLSSRLFFFFAGCAARASPSSKDRRTEHELPTVDLLVLGAYLAAVVGIGLWLGRRGGDAADFMAAGRAMPGWAVGLSMFGSYISSISFLANPGEAYANNWNAVAFTLATPLAAAIAVRWFVPFYLRQGEISAYEHLERRFGRWARTYAVVCFLLYQMARMGTVVYLLALAVRGLTQWDVAATIIVTGALMTIYTMAGGIKAVVWVGVLQSGILIAGTLVCLAAVILTAPGGLAEIVRVGAEQDKFSLGSFGPSLSESTFWVVFVFGLVTHLTNFGVDQSYVQRYLTARSDRDAKRSVWLTAWLYLPVAPVFFFIGTSLFVFYGRPEFATEGVRPDTAFPHFIATQLPVGLAGLVVAAIFAASMDSNLNSMATLTLCDLYKPYLRPHAGEKESMRVLHLSTLFWGVAGTGVGLAMIRVERALDAWWNLAGFFSGGVLGLFLLGLVSRRAGPAAGVLGVVLGMAVTVWMVLPSLMDVPDLLRNPWHARMTIVVGTITILLAGLAATALVRPDRVSSSQSE
jgi:SSS family solute:Na+ symporter